MITKQVIAEFNKSNKEKEGSREILKRQVTEVQKKIDRLEERLILEEITLDLYNKYVPKLKLEILELEKALLKTSSRVSNLAEGVKKVMDLCGNLRKMWQLLPYKDKQIFQNLVFPDGIWYNKKTGECRTTKINAVFRCIAHLADNLAKIKMGESKLIFDPPPGGASRIFASGKVPLPNRS